MRVIIPASSANLGPGFDCLGLAWQLYNEMEFTPWDSLCIEGCPEQYRNGDNLAYRGYLAALEAAGLPRSPVRICFLDTNIPVCRGLGSSSALIAAGVLAAVRLHGLDMGREEQLLVAARLEGHPDNVAPAILGGFTAALMENGAVLTARYSVSNKLFFTALIPDFELSTAQARRVLPAQVPRADALFNVSRALLLVKAMETGDSELLSAALRDKLHQPYRFPLIPGSGRVRELAEELGAGGFCISGAGSTLLCISDREDFSGRMAGAMAAEFPAWRVLPVKPDLSGARVLD